MIRRQWSGHLFWCGIALTGVMFQSDFEGITASCAGRPSILSEIAGSRTFRRVFSANASMRPSPGMVGPVWCSLLVLQFGAKQRAARARCVVERKHGSRAAPRGKEIGGN
jgi:hypothetical protein